MSEIRRNFPTFIHLNLNKPYIERIYQMSSWQFFKILFYIPLSESEEYIWCILSMYGLFRV